MSKEADQAQPSPERNTALKSSSPIPGSFPARTPPVASHRPHRSLPSAPAAPPAPRVPSRAPLTPAPPSLPPSLPSPPLLRRPPWGEKSGAGRGEEVGDPRRGVLPPPLHPDQRPSSRSPQTPPGKPQSPSSPTPPPPPQPKHPGGLDLLGSFQPSLDESGLALLGSRPEILVLAI
uniref:Uncharacterized protein n=1 Tax=Oryza nivara TaxID=4536 RepID=A0A0E0IAA4_ORYNI